MPDLTLLRHSARPGRTWYSTPGMLALDSDSVGARDPVRHPPALTPIGQRTLHPAGRSRVAHRWCRTRRGRSVQVTDTGLQATSHPAWRRSSYGPTTATAGSQSPSTSRTSCVGCHRSARAASDFALRSHRDHVWRSPYQHVHAIRPGIFEVDREGWAPPHVVRRDDLPSPTLRGTRGRRQYLAAFDSVVVAITLRPGRALRMSGGLDSHLVAAVVAVQGRDACLRAHAAGFRTAEPRSRVASR